MNDERTQILQMLRNGKISVDEAQSLLEALDKGNQVSESVADPSTGPERPSGRRAYRHRRRDQDDLIDQVLELRIHGIDGRFITEMKEMGFTDLAANELVELKIHGVSPRYIEEIRRAGFEDATVGELVEMCTHDVDADYIRQMREATGRDLTVEQLVALRIHDVDADVFAEILNLGLIDVKAKSAGMAESE